jgi:proteasome accessory factor B
MTTPLSHRTERLNAIEQMLFRNPAGLRVVEIAASCEVDRRTIYRDLNALMKTGVPVYQKEGRFFVHQDYYLATLRLNLTEAAMVMIAIRAQMNAQEHHNPHLISVLRKLGTIVPELPAMHLSSLVHTLWSTPIDRAYVQILEVLIRAWGDHQVVKLWYGEHAHEFAIYFIEPSPFGGEYALGYDYVRRKVCAVKLRRIKRAKLLKTTYELPSQEELQHYLPYGGAMAEAGDASGDEVALAVQPEALETIRQQLKFPVVAEALPDNRALVQFRVSDWRMVVAWIRALGTQVEVLAPPPLRDTLAAEAAALMKTYGARK